MRSFQDRIDVLARDGVLDVEDVDFAVAAALADGVVAPAEVEAFRQVALLYAGMLEPGAQAWLDAWGAGRRPAAPSRVLLAPHPRGQPVDLYQPRRDVVALQDALTALGHTTVVDGDYGPGTARSVAAFQAAAALPASGVVDTVTLRVLNERLDAAGQPLLDVTLRDHVRPDQVLAARGSCPPDVARRVEEALDRLGLAVGRPEWRCPVTGRFDDPTEAALRSFQHTAWLPRTGFVDRATLAALREAQRLAGLPLLELPDVPADPGAVELHFYPGDGERKLYVRRGGAVLDTYAMVGGVEVGQPDPRNPAVSYDPTPAGSYEVVDISPHTSGAWAASYVPFGAPLRESGGEVQFRDERGAWVYATGAQSPFAGRTPPPLPASAYRQSDGSLMPTWRFNDFGHLRARLKDLRTGTVVSHMIHSSPGNELTPRYYADTRTYLDAAVAVAELHFSHGCEHIHPRDFDELVSKGYLRVGTRFVVHGYDERAGGGGIV